MPSNQPLKSNLVGDSPVILHSDGRNLFCIKVISGSHVRFLDQTFSVKKSDFNFLFSIYTVIP